MTTSLAALGLIFKLTLDKSPTGRKVLILTAREKLARDAMDEVAAALQSMPILERLGSQRRRTHGANEIHLSTGDKVAATSVADLVHRDRLLGVDLLVITGDARRELWEQRPAARDVDRYVVRGGEVVSW